MYSQSPYENFMIPSSLFVITPSPLKNITKTPYPFEKAEYLSAACLNSNGFKKHIAISYTMTLIYCKFIYIYMFWHSPLSIQKFFIILILEF